MNDKEKAAALAGMVMDVHEAIVIGSLIIAVLFGGALWALLAWVL